MSLWTHRELTERHRVCVKESILNDYTIKASEKHTNVIENEIEDWLKSALC